MRMRTQSRKRTESSHSNGNDTTYPAAPGVLSPLVTALLPCRHPDKNPDNQEHAKSRFQEVYAAHQKVTQPESDSEDEYCMDDDDMEDAFSFFMHM